jgi:hypothetical protein
VGDSPRHSVLGPSFCAIFRSPSHVLLMVLRSTSSTAHPRSAGFIGDMVGPATQKGALLFIQKTSLQHAEMPMLGGRSRNCVRVAPLKTRGCDEVAVETVSCDCRRTRTTSSGVTVGISYLFYRNLLLVTTNMGECTHLTTMSRCCPTPRTASFVRATLRPCPQSCPPLRLSAWLSPCFPLL